MKQLIVWEASEVAALLNLTIPAVKSALRRARTTMAARGAKVGAHAGSGDQGAAGPVRTGRGDGGYH